MGVTSVTMGRPILVVEPDPALRTSMAHMLRTEGYFVLALGDETIAREMVRENPFSLVLFDPTSLQETRLDFCQQLRTSPQAEALPLVLLLTHERQILQVEQRGLRATDYLLKPVAWEELRACVRTLVHTGRRRRPHSSVNARRRAEQRGTKAQEPLLCVGDLCIHLAQRTVSRREQILPLGRPMLFDLLVYLVRHPGVALSRQKLLHQVWGYEWSSIQEHMLHTVSVHVHWLREVLEDDPDHPQLLQTVRGIGYRFNA